METNLAFLPQTILDAILSLDDMSLGVLRLWITGNKALQYKLKGVTRIKLTDHRDFTLNRFPKLIENFRALRELTIDRHCYPVLHYPRLREHVKNLPPTLRKLKLRILDAYKIISSDVPSNASATSPSASFDTRTGLENRNWTFATAFPRLEVLDLGSTQQWTPSDLALLPRSLTSLTLKQLLWNAGEEFSRSIPRQILTLKVSEGGAKGPSFWSNLPPQLQHLKWQGEWKGAGAGFMEDVHPSLAEVASSLPKTLVKLSANLEYFPVDSLTLLPPDITNLYTHNPDLSKVYHLDEVGDEVGLHFKKLEFFKTSWLPPSLLRTLSSTVKTIISRATSSTDYTTVKPTEWPSSLTELRLETSENFPISILPSSGLVTLVLTGRTLIDVDKMSLLPSTLRSLKCALGLPAGDFDFPPHLTSFILNENYYSYCLEDWLKVEANGLEFDDSFENEDKETVNVKVPFQPSAPEHRAFLNGLKVLSCFSYHTLPKSLITLEIPFVVPASQMKYLPPQLKTLKVADIFADAEFEPESARELDNLRSVFEIGRQEVIRESFDWTQLKQVSIIALLPRTLTKLEVEVDALSGIADWSHLPPNLTSLILLPDAGLPSDIVYHLPRNRFQHLTLRLDSPRDEHIKALPRDVEELCLFADDGSQLSMLLVIDLPFGTTEVDLSDSALEKALGLFYDAKSAHERDADPTDFINVLLGRDEQLRSRLLELSSNRVKIVDSDD